VSTSAVGVGAVADERAACRCSWGYWQHVAEFAKFLVASRSVSPRLEADVFSWRPVVLDTELALHRSQLVRSMPARARAGPA
jgi:hypothetical protein